MFTRAPERNRWLTLLVAASLLLAGLRAPTTLGWAKDRKPIVVSFGQPNIWSLEQAHYLLARMHMTNLELQAKALTDKELDPNATNGTRIQILKQLLEINGQFDQGVGFQNRRIVENARFNDSRRRELITRRDGNRAEVTGLKREIARLEIERARMDSDPSASDEAKALKKLEIDGKNKEVAALNEQISQDDDEFKTLAAEPSGTPTSPTAVATPGQLPTSVLDKLVEKNVQDLFKAQDARLNATTMLDNTVQLQYEIIAKQLTLLRDEVGPGERLIFLELPQSIYSTPGSGDEKMAQTWWHVNGYTRTDPLVRLLLELFEVESKWSKIKEIQAFKDRQPIVESVTNCEEIAQSTLIQMKGDPILDLFVGLKCERASARKAVLAKLYREANSLFARVEQNGARNTSELVEAIRKVISVEQTDQVVAKKPGDEALLSAQQVEVDRRKKADDLKRLLLEMLSEKEPMTSKRLSELGTEYKIQDGTEFERGIEFISLDDKGATREGRSDVQRRTVRTVDIIPRQSSLNVNDIQETVKATGILAAFKFLFGFAGQVNFQRQREQYEQFVHQELYASGFGKGSRDFGWTFGALPGTKRVAPGVRTTFAALVVPNDAESVVVSARGCYFPRNKYQPLDFEDTRDGDWSNPGDYRRYNCGDEQKYILAVPGGGETSNFWVTNVDYQDGKKDGEFVTVSVRGNNFSSQMGVLIDGVPLFASVGLAQPHLMPRRPAPAEGQQATTAAFDCAGVQDGICGRYERIDSDQIVFSFRMPTNYVGTPTLTLIAPGKAVDLNSIGMRINSKTNVNLRDDAAFMFGRRPAAVLSIADLQVLNVTVTPPAAPGGTPSTTVTALLTGTGFDNANNRVYVEGRELTAASAKTFRSSNLYELQFIPPAGDSLEVTIVQGTETVSKTFSNPPGLKISNATVLSYDAAANNTPAVMTVKLEGSGFTNHLRPVVDGAAQSRLVNVSSREVIVRLVSPETVVVIGLEDTQTRGRSPGVVVQRPKP